MPPGVTSGLNVHHARHTFAMELRRVAGIDAASHALGHSDLSTTLGIYGHRDGSAPARTASGSSDAASGDGGPSARVRPNPEVRAHCKNHPAGRVPQHTLRALAESGRRAESSKTARRPAVAQGGESTGPAGGVPPAGRPKGPRMAPPFSALARLATPNEQGRRPYGWLPAHAHVRHTAAAQVSRRRTGHSPQIPQRLTQTVRAKG